ncbi:MAG: hypothetical protein WAV40_04235 [Microgenomates group bacterium]
MELGNFLGKLKGQTKEPAEKFLALILTDEVVQASVWSVVNEATEILAIGTPVEWDGDTGTTSELITAVDATISSATEGEKDEPSKVILGIPNSWIDKGGVLGVKKDFIVKIRKELDLETIGYVVITDSVLSYLKMQEGTPTTSILIQVSRDELAILLVRLGHIEAIETIGRSDDVVEDVAEGVARFKVLDNLPSRIILFNSMHNLDDIIQNLLSTDWPKQFNFLHTPKIEALPKDVAIRALSVAGGSEVAKSLGFSVAATTITNPELNQETSPVKEESNLIEVDESDYLSAEEIGFTQPLKEVEKVDFIDPDDEPPIVAPEPKVEKPKFVAPKITIPRFKLPTLKFALPHFNSLWIMIASGTLLFTGFILYLIYFLPKADITVSVIPKNLDQTIELTLSTQDSGVDYANAIVPAEVTTVSESGEKIAETTGKKTIGNPAKGDITIYNRTSTVKTLAKGVTLSAGSLKFTLDSETMVASGSSSNDYVGKSTGNITASSIGEDSNLAAGTELTIASFGKDSYVAKNDAALTGGTSEEIQVVGKDDQKSLAKELTAELLEKLKSSSLDSSSPGIGIYLIEDSSVAEDVVYSAKTGESAKSLKLTMSIKATLLKYKTDEVTNLVNAAIDSEVPAGYVRAGLPSTVDLTASSISEDETKVKGTAKVQVALLPVIDSPKIISSIKGKNPSALESILSTSIPGYQSAVVSFTPKALPARLKSIPRITPHIKLVIMPAI